MTSYYLEDDYGDCLEIEDDLDQSETALVRGTRSGVYVPSDKVDEVCNALRAAAGLPPVWFVAKRPDAYEGWMSIGPSGFITNARPGVGTYTVDGARDAAARFLAAADEAETRATRSKLPTWPRTMVQVGDCAWVRSNLDRWTPVEKQGHFVVVMTDSAMSTEDFTILYDPKRKGAETND